MMQVMSHIMKVNISYIKQESVFSDIGRTDIYFFYPNNIWDDDKLIYEEALKKYPSDKYNWILIQDND